MTLDKMSVDIMTLDEMSGYRELAVFDPTTNQVRSIQQKEKNKEH
jgi:hypothetical protein